MASSLKSLITSAAWTASGMASRIGAGMLVFVGMARYMSTVEFGQFMVALAVAGVCALPVNFGHVVMVLREGAAQDGRLSGLVASIFRFKALVAVVALGAVSLWAWSGPVPSWWLPLVCLAIFVEAFSDVLLGALRAQSLNRTEAAWSIALAAVHMGAMAIALWRWPTLLGVCVAFLCSRLVGLVMLALATEVGRSSFTQTPTQTLRSVATTGLTNATETTVQNLLILVDTLILAWVSGAQQVGAYQAVMKLVHGASQALTLMVNVLLPRLSRQFDQEGERALHAVSGRLRWLMAAAGLLLASIFWALSGWVEQTLYAGKFTGLTELMLLGGAVLLFRFMAAGEGLMLIVRRASKQRVVGISCGLAVVVLVGVPAAKASGAFGMMCAMVAAFFTIFVAARFRRGPSEKS